MSSRRTRTSPPLLVLTREPGLTIAGRDADGDAWIGMDATKSDLACLRCAQRIEYGYTPLLGARARAHCVKCVEFVDQEPGR